MMGSRSRVRGRCLAVILGLLAAGPALRSQEGGVDSLLDQGMLAYRQGDLTSAKSSFEKAFSQQPSNDLIMGWLEKVGVARLMEMARDDDRQISGIALEILQGARSYRRQKVGDAEAVDRAVQEVLALEADEQILKIHAYTIDMGRNLVPALVPVLGDAEIERRTVAFSWIARIGREALPPLVAAWQHPDDRVRMNIARLLSASSLRHPYALAYLKAMAETDEIAEIRQAATQSFNAVLGSVGESREGSRPAKVLFLRNAAKLYLDPAANPFDDSSYTSKVYRVEGGRVVAEDVAPFQFSERMAMQNLEEALRLDPSYYLAHVLNLLNDSAQVVEYDVNVAWYEKQGGFEEERALLAAQQSRMDSVMRLRTKSAPAKLMYDALAQALKDGRSEVARYVIERIRERKLRGPVPYSLVDALRDPSSRLVRIAAAITLAEWSPQSDFDAGADVVSTLASAVVQSGIRTVVKAMGNQDRANRLDAVLDRLHMESRFHLQTASNAYATITNIPPDLVLIDDELRRDIEREDVKPVSLLVDQLRRNYRTADVAVVVVVEPSMLEEKKREYENPERKVLVVPADVTPEQFSASVVEPLFGDKDDAKAFATELAAAAARAIEHLASSRNPLFPVSESVPSLGMVLSNRPDSIRAPCIRALGALGATSVVDELAQLYASEADPVEIRSEAMRSIGRILAAGGSPISETAGKILMDGTRSIDLSLRSAAWMAFADSGLPAEARLELLTSSAIASAEAAGPAEELPEAGAGFDDGGAGLDGLDDLDDAGGLDAGDADPFGGL